MLVAASKMRIFLTSPAWRNWQTRWTQNPVAARPCGFEPLRRQVYLHIQRWTLGVDVCSDELISLSLGKSRDTSTSLSMIDDPDFRSSDPISHFSREQTAAAHNLSCCLCLYGSAKTTMFTRDREERPAG